MNFLASSASIVIAIAAVLTFYTALLHLTRRNKRRSFLFRVVRDLLVGLQTLQLYFVTQDLHLQYPFLLYLFVTLLFLSGPLNYIRYFMFFYPGGQIPARIKVQILPAVVVFLGETWFYFVNQAQSQAVIRDVFSNPTQYAASYLILAGVIVALIQYGMLLRLETRFVNSDATREPVLISSAVVILYMINMLLIAAGFITANRVVMNIGILFIGFAGIVYLLFENRYPDFYQLVAREQKQERYKKSLIQGLSREQDHCPPA